MLGKATPKEYEDHVVTNFEIVRLRSRIMAHADESIKPDKCQVAVELTDGMELEKHVQHVAGSLEVLITHEQLVEKFLDKATTDISHVDASDLSKEILLDMPEGDCPDVIMKIMG